MSSVTKVLNPAIAQNVFGRALREKGQALDRLGLRIGASLAYETTLTRHRTIMPVGVDRKPEVADAFVAPTASVIGNVRVADGASVWYSSVLRADQVPNTITIGANSNVQDRSVLSAQSGSIHIGEEVTIGHGALIDGHVSVGAKCLIGQGSILCESVTVGSGSIVAAGAVVLPRTEIPPGQMWAGNPAAFVREVKAEETQQFSAQATHYVELAAQHKKEFSG
jgi:gamma-carbonic anhydrase